MMKKIVLDIQSDIHAHTMERMLMQKLDDCQVVISESPDATAEWDEHICPGCDGWVTDKEDEDEFC